MITLDVGADKGAPQARFYLSKARLPAYFSGIGAGKTTALLLSFFRYAGENPKSRQILTEPSFPMVKDILLPKIKDLFGYMRGQNFTMTESPPYDVKFTNESEIWLRSAEVNERLYGPDVARCAMDEVTLGYQEDAYNVLLGRIRQKGFHNQLLVTGTPKGRNWVWKRYFGDPSPEMEVFEAETADNKHLREGYVEELIRAYGGPDAPLARQELGGAWVQMAGQVFPQFSRSLHILSLDSSEVLKDKLGGIDFGGVSPTALIGCGMTAAGRVHAFREWYKHESTMEQTIEAMASFREVGITKWIADPAGKRETEILRRAGFEIRAARHGNKIALRTQLFGARLNQDVNKLPGMYISPQCPNLITEVETLAWKRVRLQGRTDEIMNDEFERGAPDHAFDAATNVIAEYDGRPAKVVRPREPVKLYGDY